MNLFDKEFYPTPKEVAIKMAMPYAEQLGYARILEPSAGNGAILDAVVKDGVPYTYRSKNGEIHDLTANARKENIYCIEKNPELQMILQEKGYRVIASDFLTYTPDHDFDLALINPPFFCGDKHLLHAWDILREGDIACLLNAETIQNPYTKTRKLLAKIIEENGSVEDLGRCFHSADNSTDVEVVLVRLHKKGNCANVFELGEGTFSSEQEQNFAQDAVGGDLEQSNRLDAYLRAWTLTKTYAVDFIKSYQKLRLYLSSFLNSQVSDERYKQNGGDIITTIVKALGEHNDPRGAQRAYETFIDEVKARAWNIIISNMGLDKYMTSSMRDTMDKFRKAQGNFELTKENILALFQLLMANLANIMKNNVVSVYDTFTRYYKDNTSYTEGWKSNKRFRANKKIVLPNMVSAGFKPEVYGYDKTFSISWNGSDLDDIDKAMCWLSGRKFEELDGADPERSTIYRTIQKYSVGDTAWATSAFFLVKCFKKGTVHLQFRDDNLLDKFNIAVNEGKNELGSGDE